MTAPARAARASAAVLAAGALLLAACGAPKPATTITPLATAAKGTPPTPLIQGRWPLTGIDGDMVRRPAVSVKIENSPESRPQTGLGEADIVYEEMVEGGISRFVAIFHSRLPKDIGPIRSIRPMDGPITAPTKGLLVFSGGKAPFQATAREDGLQLLSQDAGSKGFYRTTDKPAPHNVHGSLSEFLAQADADHKEPPRAMFAYAPDPAQASAAADGAAVATLVTSISAVQHTQWKWDAASGQFQRYDGEQVATDTITSKPIGAANVVALWVTTQIAPGVDPAGNSIPETVLIDSSGKGVVATGGKQIPVTWSKKDAANPITIKTKDGKTARLAPGNTWVELVPQSTGAITPS